MPDKALEERRRALERAFFRDESRTPSAAERQALEDASGIHEPAILEKLASLGIRAETLAALTLIPLVEIAWADGRMEDREREAVLAGAESTGVAKGSPSHGLLRIWLEDRPAPALHHAWREFIAALCTELTPTERRRLRQRIVEGTRRVAEAAGGFLGIGEKISPDEERVLTGLGRAFGD
jgi:hypothetical protein